MSSTTTRVIPDEYTDLLEKKGFAHLASIGPDGAPQSHPVWYGHDGGTIEISTTADRQKALNVRREPRVALTITDPDNPYRYLEVRGRVEELRPDPGSEFIDALAEKYLDRDEYPYKQPGEERVILRIRPEKANTMG